MDFPSYFQVESVFLFVCCVLESQESFKKRKAPLLMMSLLSWNCVHAINSISLNTFHLVYYKNEYGFQTLFNRLAFPAWHERKGPLTLDLLTFNLWPFPPGSWGDPHAGQQPVHVPVRRLRLWRGSVWADVWNPALLQHQQQRPGDLPSTVQPGITSHLQGFLWASSCWWS